MRTPRPLLLVRFPGALVAIFAAAVILAVASASGPLFLSSSGNAALALGLREQPRTSILSVTAYGPVRPDLLGFLDRQLSRAVGSIRGLGPATQSIVGGAVDAEAGAAATAPVQLVATPGFAGQVTRVGPVAGPAAGVWIADTTARALGVRAGDRLELRAGGKTVSVPVRGVFSDLYQQPLTPFWAPLAGDIYGGGARQTTPSPERPAPFLLASPATILRIGAALGSAGRYRWDYGLYPAVPSLPQAQTLARRLQGLQRTLADPATQLGAAFAGSVATTPLPGIVAGAVSAAGGIQGPVGTVALAGTILALAAIAVAGVYGVRLRRAEYALLAARGVSPWRLAETAGAEVVIPVAFGAAAGWALCVRLVGSLGPSGLILRGAIAASARDAAGAAIVAILLLAAVTAMTGRGYEETAGRGREVLARTPWEGIVLALAAASFYEILARGAAPVSTAGQAPHLDRLLLLFPILFIAGTAGLVVRAAELYVVRLRSAGSGWSPSLFLAGRRLASSPRVALLLVTASCLAIGILAYAAILVTSVRATAVEKAQVAVGSDVAVPLAARSLMPPHPPVPMTQVVMIGQSTVAPSARPVTILGVDPRTFATAVEWRSGFSETSLAGLMKAISGGSPARLPAIVAGPGVTPGSTLSPYSFHVPMAVVGRASAFPGMRGGGTVVVVDARTLGQALNAAGAGLSSVDSRWEVWAKGGAGAVMRTLAAAHVPAGRPVTAAQVLRRPAFLAASWTFGFLQALGVMAGVVVLIGMLLYLQARQRQREVSYALSRRMGLARAAHRGSIALELGAMLLAALVTGFGLATAAAALVYRRVDLMPGLPPGPLLRIPLDVVGFVAAALALCSFAGAWLVQRRADRANVAEVMRLAG